MLTTHNVVQTLRRRDMPGAISLLKRRAWFADDPGDPANGNGQQGGAGNNDDENGQVPLTSLPKAVQEYISDLRQQAADYRTKYKELADQTGKEAEQRLTQNQQYKELAEKRALRLNELEPLAEQATDAAAFLKSLNAQTIEAIPEGQRTMVPDFGDSYDGQKRLAAWLKTNAARLTNKPAPDFDAGAGGGGRGGSGSSGPKVTDADREQARIAQAYGHQVTAEDIAKNREELESQRAGRRDES